VSDLAVVVYSHDQGSEMLFDVFEQGELVAGEFQLTVVRDQQITDAFRAGHEWNDLGILAFIFTGYDAVLPEGFFDQRTQFRGDHGVSAAIVAVEAIEV